MEEKTRREKRVDVSCLLYSATKKTFEITKTTEFSGIL